MVIASVVFTPDKQMAAFSSTRSAAAGLLLFIADGCRCRKLWIDDAARAILGQIRLKSSEQTYFDTGEHVPKKGV
jgi:hypothetical protein